MDVFDDPVTYPGEVLEEAKKRFEKHYLDPLGKDVRYVRLESGFRIYMLGPYADFFFWQK